MQENKIVIRNATVSTRILTNKDTSNILSLRRNSNDNNIEVEDLVYLVSACKEGQDSIVTGIFVDEELAGAVDIDYFNGELREYTYKFNPNTHICLVIQNITVKYKYRANGLAEDLIYTVVDKYKACQNKNIILIANTFIATGEDFFKHIGFKRCFDRHVREFI